MTDTTDEDRPQGSCLLHRPPREGQSWFLADPGYLTCSGCLTRLRERLQEISKRYYQLNPRPGQSGDGTRGAPGFGSRAPASVHVISMRDPRSSSMAKAWVGSDGRVHLEQENPPLSVQSVLETEAFDIAEKRGMDGPGAGRSVDELAQWLDKQLDWLTRQPDVVELDACSRKLLAQLRPATGDPAPTPVGYCIEQLEDRECGHPVFMPPSDPRPPDEPVRDLPTLTCGGCGSRYTGERIIRLRLAREQQATA